VTHIRSIWPAFALVLSGCAVGPHYAPPPVPSAAGGAFVSLPATPVASPAASPDTWWRLYNDAALDALVAQALVANTDLRVAEANLRHAHALLAEARTQQLPSTVVSAGGGYGRLAATQTTSAVDSSFVQAGFDVNYEIDLFGRVSNSVRAARADVAATEAARDGVRVVVAAETARAYADACSQAAQLRVAEGTLALQTQTFDLTERQARAGRGGPDEVERARAQLESVRATLPVYTALRANALFRLAVLTGQPPSTPIPAAANCTVAPVLKAPLPVGDGTELLKRRPDVRQADRVLAASIARIGVATAGLYPTVSLGGSINTAGVNFSDLGKSSGVSFNLGPLISWSFPNIALARAQIAAAQATSDAALASFDGTVLTALEETEAALANYANDLVRNTALINARDHNAEAVRIIRLRYQYGAESFLNVLDAQRALADAEATLAANQAALTSDQITVFKALGGGWQDQSQGQNQAASAGTAGAASAPTN
jgi:outer membrane protein, multidrug efflux system